VLSITGVHMPRLVVYLGPSLSIEQANAVVDADYLPPIKRGDLAQVPADTCVIAIIDGEFYQSLAVTPKEILELLARGVVVYGASSMGALRAAELHPYGMIGVGEIFRMYRDGILDADDEVAQLYTPDTFVSCSEPLVNIRFALDSATRAGIISSYRADELVRRLKSLYFPDRSYRLVSQLCPELTSFLQNTVSLKANDAKLLLSLLATRVRAKHAEDN